MIFDWSYFFVDLHPQRDIHKLDFAVSFFLVIVAETHAIALFEVPNLLIKFFRLVQSHRVSGIKLRKNSWLC